MYHPFSKRWRAAGNGVTWLALSLRLCALAVSSALVALAAQAQTLATSAAASSAAPAAGQWMQAATRAVIVPPRDTDDIRYGIFKSDQDTRRYRYLVLPNKMRVLLVSDPTSEKSSAALSVRVGSYDNPADREGLAHFLEHMLFLGTQKYPAADDYQQFIGAHGGSHNAYTSLETTTYFFDVGSDHFAPALDRFAQFFIAPLFAAQYVERERQAVHAEYTAKLKDDGRREWEVLRELINPAHPAAKFSVGNTATLADRDGRNLRDELINFYETHYSADRMAAVMVGRESIETLTLWAKTYFAAVPLREYPKLQPYPALFTPGTLPLAVEIKPEQELRKLTYQFPVQFDANLEAHKSWDYIAHLLGHEGKGSLIAFLRRLGWAESLSAGLSFKSRFDGIFTLSINLTAEGVRAREQMHSLVFYQIDQLRQRGVASWRYQELQEVAEAQFRFAEKPKPIDASVHLVEQLFWYEPAQILRNQRWYAGLHERQLQRAFERLQPHNVLISLVAPEVQGNRVGPRYEVPFIVRHQRPLLAELKPAVRQELQLPERNPFIAKRFDVKSPSLLDRASGSETTPELIYRDRNAQVWFAPGREFNQPKAVLKLNLKMPQVAGSVMGAASAQLLAALVNESLIPATYPSQIAGMNYQLHAHARGLQVEFDGFSARQSLLLNQVVDALREPALRADRFELKRAQLIRELRNRDKAMPYLVALNTLDVLQASPAWSNTQLIEALEALDFAKFQRFAANAFIDAKLDMLVYGNYFRQEALKLSAMVDHHLLARQTGRVMPAAALYGVAGAQTAPLSYVKTMDHADQVALMWVSAEAIDTSAMAHLRILQQSVKSGFYHQLRTQQQLGYVVAALLRPVQHLDGIGFLIQSPTHSVNEMVDAMRAYFLDAQPRITDNFTTHQAAVVNRLRESALSLEEQAASYWESILVEDWGFNRRERLAQAAQLVTEESLKVFYKQRILAPETQLWVLSAPYTGNAVFDAISDPASHRQARRSFPF